MLLLSDFISTITGFVLDVILCSLATAGVEIEEYDFFWQRFSLYSHILHYKKRTLVMIMKKISLCNLLHLLPFGWWSFWTCFWCMVWWYLGGSGFGINNSLNVFLNNASSDIALNLIRKLWPCQNEITLQLVPILIGSTFLMHLL